MGFEHGGVGGEVSWRSRVRLDVDAPQCRVQVEGFQRPFLAQQLDLVDDFCPAVIPDKEENDSLIHFTDRDRTFDDIPIFVFEAEISSLKHIFIQLLPKCNVFSRSRQVEHLHVKPVSHATHLFAAKDQKPFEPNRKPLKRFQGR